MVGLGVPSTFTLNSTFSCSRAMVSLSMRTKYGAIWREEEVEEKSLFVDLAKELESMKEEIQGQFFCKELVDLDSWHINDHRLARLTGLAGTRVVVGYHPGQHGHHHQHQNLTRSPEPVHDSIENIGEGAPRLKPLNMGLDMRISAQTRRWHLDEGDLDPVVGLDVEHVDLVPCDREAPVVLGASEYIS